MADERWKLLEGEYGIKILTCEGKVGGFRQKFLKPPREAPARCLY